MDDYEDEHLEAGMAHIAGRLADVTQEHDELKQQLEAVERERRQMAKLLLSADRLVLASTGSPLMQSSACQRMAELAEETTHE